MNTENLYDPSLIDRGEDGQFWHPDLPFPDGAEMENESVDISGALAAQGYEYDRVMAPDDYPSGIENEDAYWAWLREWQPTAPEGDGWMLACIADTEDGPAAWFVRPNGGVA